MSTSNCPEYKRLEQQVRATDQLVSALEQSLLQAKVLVAEKKAARAAADFTGVIPVPGAGIIANKLRDLEDQLNNAEREYNNAVANLENAKQRQREANGALSSHTSSCAICKQ